MLGSGVPEENFVKRRVGVIWGVFKDFRHLKTIEQRVMSMQTHI